MSKKCKFDLQWEQALSLLSQDDAVKAREIIENYQATGTMPQNVEPRFEMILLLVQPTIDRRRRAAISARLRRQRLKEAQAGQPQMPSEPPAQVPVQPHAANEPNTNCKQHPRIQKTSRRRRRKQALLRKRQEQLGSITPSFNDY